MTAQGMVHALDEIHRLLVPDGCLIDIHPIAESPALEVHLGKHVIFAETKPDYCTEGFRQADEALQKAVQNQQYAVTESVLFDFLVFASSTTELYDYLDVLEAYDIESAEEGRTPLELKQLARIDEIMSDAKAGAEVATHEKVHMTKLLPIRT